MTRNEGHDLQHLFVAPSLEDWASSPGAMRLCRLGLEALRNWDDGFR